MLKTDLLLGEKLLDEGKQLGLIGKVRALRLGDLVNYAYHQFQSLSGTM